MATFWPKSLLTRGFPQQRSAQGEDDRHGAEEEEPAAEARGAGDAPDEGWPDEKPEVAEDGDGGEGGASSPLAAEPPGEREQRRRGQRQAGAGDPEPEQRHEGVVRSGG